MFQAIVFDIGQTLVEYRMPINWSKLYRPVLAHIAEKFQYSFSEEQCENFGGILSKYNTRIHPRDHEVSSGQIFTELLHGLDLPLKDLEQFKHCFYSYFRQDASLYPDAEKALKALSGRGLLIGTLSDVAYGMDNEFALEDIAPILQYVDYPFTSNDAGYRKPSTEGLKMLGEKMGIPTSDMVFVGDEEKDIICGKRAGAYAVLVNRDGTAKNYGQDREIQSLTELLDFVG